jgi:peroxiredoxin
MHTNTTRWQARLGLLATLIVLTLSVGRIVAHTRSTWGRTADLEVGREAPAFVLTSVDGQTVDFAAFGRDVVVLAYTSQQCPVSNEYAARFRQLVASYAGDDRVRFFEINGDVASGQLSAAQVRHTARKSGAAHTLLVDPGTFARAYDVEFTPTFYVIGPGGVLRYCGAFDDNRSEPAVTHAYVEEAVKRLLDGVPLAYTSTHPIGCRLPTPVQ